MVDRAGQLLQRALGILDREDGQALIEYALIISLIGIIAIGGITLMGRRVDEMFSGIGNTINFP